MPNRLCLPARVRLMPKHIQRKYANGQFDRTGTYAGALPKTVGGTYFFCHAQNSYCYSSSGEDCCGGD